MVSTIVGSAYTLKHSCARLDDCSYLNPWHERAFMEGGNYFVGRQASIVLGHVTVGACGHLSQSDAAKPSSCGSESRALKGVVFALCGYSSTCCDWPIHKSEENPERKPRHRDGDGKPYSCNRGANFEFTSHSPGIFFEQHVPDRNRHKKLDRPRRRARIGRTPRVIGVATTNDQVKVRGKF